MGSVVFHLTVLQSAFAEVEARRRPPASRGRPAASPGGYRFPSCSCQRISLNDGAPVPATVPGVTGSFWLVACGAVGCIGTGSTASDSANAVAPVSAMDAPSTSRARILFIVVPPFVDDVLLNRSSPDTPALRRWIGSRRRNRGHRWSERAPWDWVLERGTTA